MDRYPSLGDHRLTGDLQTGALVITDGTVDWFCCPRFDSPGVFASLATLGSVFTCRRHSGAGPLRSSVWYRVFRP
jgi:GH15 family glucan-1,4-alpha-glucosidase